jgi:hypothetical protein
MFWKLWVIYFAAQLIHMTVRAGLSTRSQLTPWDSLRQYVSKFWPQLVARVFLASLAFWWWIHSPAQVGTVVLLPVNPATAGIFGWFSDSVLDKVIALLLPTAKVALPALPDEDQADSAAAGK